MAIRNDSIDFDTEPQQTKTLTTVVLDTNTIWRKKPFLALAELRDVLMMQPADPRAAMRHGVWANTKQAQHRADAVHVLMPPGWASRFSGFACRRLIKAAEKIVRRRGSQITEVIVTSPHYHPMIAICERMGISLFYYGSDDYALYDRWGGKTILKCESEIVRAARHSFFVSQPLCDRAIDQYGVESDKVSVSPNATSEHFLRPQTRQAITGLQNSIADLKSPIVGVVGTINARLDFGLLQQCLELKSLGTLLFVGRTTTNWQNEAWTKIKCHKKCIHVGQQPHDTLPIWMQMLDVALIPYFDHQFNRACSPMRLFDHLASGRPIVATSACTQCFEHEPHVKVGSTPSEFVELVEQSLSSCREMQSFDGMKYAADNHTWRVRASKINEKITRLAIARQHQ